jgi:hypothetical protein
MEPTIKGWMWNLSFYPCGSDGERVVRNIFWYDSSNDLEFTKHTGEYQILIPEADIISTPLEIQYVHKHIKEISEREMRFVRPKDDGSGKWICTIPAVVLSRTMFLRLGV